MLKIALPKGRLLEQTAGMLQKAGWDIDGYDTKLRYYRLKSKRYQNIEIKVFQEKDIPIQVAVGNYDLGICGLDWIEELLVKYPSSAVVKITDLGYGKGELYAAAKSKEAIYSAPVTRIAGEYPNLAESLAEQLRLKRFSIFPLWGAADAYPPEDAEVVLLPGNTENDMAGYGLEAIYKIATSRAYMIANRGSLKTKDMAELIKSINDNKLSEEDKCLTDYITDSNGGVCADIDDDTLRLALPDGHQQVHVKRILEIAGIKVEEYPSPSGNRRPLSNLEGVFIKVIRPQDMPLQVANNNFDLAITGRDWLTEHRLKFPSSPVMELVDLEYGRVKIVAVVSNEVAADDIASWQEICSRSQKACRVASEYTNIADDYARENRLGRYRIIPTWGATEAFLPEDADLLIENTETGGTINRHNLKIIDTLFESTACLIGSKKKITSTKKKKRTEYIIQSLNKAMENME